MVEIIIILTAYTFGFMSGMIKERINGKGKELRNWIRI